MMALGVLHMQVSAGLVTLALEAPAILVLAEAGYNAQRFADKSVPFCEAGKSIQIINYLSDWIYAACFAHDLAECLLAKPHLLPGAIPFLS